MNYPQYNQTVETFSELPLFGVNTILKKSLSHRSEKGLLYSCTITYTPNSLLLVLQENNTEKENM